MGPSVWVNGTVNWGLSEDGLMGLVGLGYQSPWFLLNGVLLGDPGAPLSPILLKLALFRS